MSEGSAVTAQLVRNGVGECESSSMEEVWLWASRR